MARDLIPIPRNIVQVEQAQITPYLANQGKPDSNEGTVFSRNRGKDLSFKDNKVKDILIKYLNNQYKLFLKLNILMILLF